VRFEFATHILPRPGTSAADTFSFPLWGPANVLEPRPAGTARNVILVSIDTLRADHLGTYGGENPTSPTLDRFAAAGTLFEHVMTTYPSTTAAHMSMLTGTYPAVHGVVAPIRQLAASIHPLAELLADAGYDTAAVTEDGMVAAAVGFRRGFSYYREFKDETPISTLGHVAEGVTAALAWLGAHHDERFFLFLHTYQVHGPYTPPPEFNLFKTYRGPDGAVRTIDATASEEDRNRLLYDGEIRYTDHELGRLLTGLDTLGLAESTIVIVTADHGEALSLTHGFLGHGWHVYEEVMHVPLMLRAPGLVPAGVRVPPPVSLVDVVPTVLALLGLPVPSYVQGRSLLPLLHDPGATPFPGRPVYGELLRSAEARTIAVRLGTWKWILNEPELRPAEVYDVTADRDELHNVATPERVAIGKALVDRFRSGVAEARANLDHPEATPVAVDEETANKLRALGYVQ